MGDARRTLHIPGFRPHLGKLVEDAVARFEAMSSEQQREMRRAQRKSWVVGEMMLEHPEMARSYAELLYDDVCP
jgi:hypothetical protein